MGKRKHNRGIRRHIELTENHNTFHQNIWGTAKAVFQGKFVPYLHNWLYQGKLLKSVI